MNINGVTTILKNWINLNDYTVLYNSDVDELSSRQINSKIKGKNNISIIVRTPEGYCFGSYHQNIIKNPPKQFLSRYRQEGGYFLFTLKNSFGVEPQQFVTIKQTDYLVLYSDENENGLIGMCSAYDLRVKGSSFSSEFPYYYNSIYPTNVFVGQTRPLTFEIESIIILKWF
ncbi:TLDc domain-containing protein [Entamoeba marina]